MAVKSTAVPLPLASHAEVFMPRLKAYVARAREDCVDVIHVATPGPIGLAALYTAWRLQRPLVGSVHMDVQAYASAFGASRHVAALVGQCVRWVYGACSRVLVPSEAARETLSGRIERSRVAVWRRGVDASLFSPHHRSRTLQEQWHVSENRPALLYVGRLSREKGVDLLPAVQRELFERHLEHRFIIVGEGPMRRELQRRMPDALFTGNLGRRQLATVFASADAFVFPSRTDTAGNVILEAQASGLPVVVSDAGGPAENLIHGESGFVCRTDEPEEWADAISRVTSRGPRAAFGTAARTYALGRGWADSLQVLYRAYGEACAGRAGSARSVRFRPGPVVRPTRPVRVSR
jgi:glycosyltransferase involved in cell wall biosynthesis